VTTCPTRSAGTAGLAELGRSPADAGALRAVARAVRPRQRARPSAWAERKVRLSDAQAEAVGPYRCDYYPWLAAFHDALHDRPGKLGVVVPKPAQVGFTQAMLNVLCAAIDTEDTSILYVIGRDEDAQNIVDVKFKPVVTAVPSLADRFDSVPQRSTQQRWPFHGGRLDFVGAGAAGNLSTLTYARVIIDEFDQAEKNFPAAYGTLPEFASGRQSAVRFGRQTWIFSHPTQPERGVWRFFLEHSDRARWTIACPRCGERFGPAHECLHFDTDQRGRPVAASVQFKCPVCHGEITDDERRRLVWPEPTERGGRAGGTGRLESPLPPAEAAGRDYLGFAVNGLCHPYRRLREFAALLCGAGDDKQRGTILNIHLGEPAALKVGAVTSEAIDQAVSHVGRLRPPSPAEDRLGGVRFVAVGCDVQAPPGNPRIYCAAVAFSAVNRYVMDLSIVQGFAAWHEYLSRLTVTLADGTSLGVRACSIDDNYLGQEVKDACRERIHADADGRRIELVPMANMSTKGSRDMPLRLRDRRRRLHPTRPELGAIPMYDMDRHESIDRVMALLRADPVRLLFIGQTPPDLRDHLMANVLRPKKGPSGIVEDVDIWDKVDDKSRDDWLMALVHAEQAAVARLHLDRLHAEVTNNPDGSRPKRVLLPRGTAPSTGDLGGFG
jgi:phage terminase large subunit GpA-like protein